MPTVDLLDARRLIASAREASGLEDLADDSVPARLADLTEQLRGRLDAEGLARAAEVIGGLLVLRLDVFEDRRRFPIADEAIDRPIIAMGEGRSGTTLLQMLLGQDPASRLLEFWEVMRPSPPPALAGPDDRRREQGDEDWREILDLIPKWLVSHPYNDMLGRNPPECERLWAIDFRALPPTAWWRVPLAPTDWPPLRIPQDHARQYEIHRMLLQHLQHGAPKRRWVLKGVEHQHRLAAVLDAYPDAIFIWMHRDPLQAIASRYELIAQIYEGIAGSIDRSAFATGTVEFCVKNFAVAAETPLADDPRIHHLVYQDFTADPISAIRAVYDREGLEFTSEFEESMRAWMAGNQSNRHGRFRYSAEALGVDVAALDRQLDPYRERFGIPREQPKG